jgi:hypothetical protein
MVAGSIRPFWFDYAARGRFSLGRRASSIIDVDGRGHAGRKNDPRRHLIDMDADRDAKQRGAIA